MSEAAPEIIRRQLQEAKQNFSHVVREAEAGRPQIVTRHGKDVAVVINIEAYKRLKGEIVGFKDHLLRGPVFDDLIIERDRDYPRDVDLTV